MTFNLLNLLRDDFALLVEKEFQKIDKDGGGQILFEEFCEWAIHMKLDYDKEFDHGDETVTRTNRFIQKDLVEIHFEAKKTNHKLGKSHKYEVYDVKKDKRARKGKKKKRNAKKFKKYASQLPVGRTNEEVQKRKRMFDSIVSSSFTVLNEVEF